MVENVTDIIVARGREPEGLKTMLVWSMAGHIGLAAIALLWRGPAAEPPRQVMMISLGGAPGPDTGGKTQIGGQAVQAPPPQEPVKPVEAPPAPTAPVMTLPTPRAPRPRPQPKPAQAPPDAAASTPNTGSVPREGDSASNPRRLERRLVGLAGAERGGCRVVAEGHALAARQRGDAKRVLEPRAARGPAPQQMRNWILGARSQRRPEDERQETCSHGGSLRDAWTRPARVDVDQPLGSQR